jgi:DNA-binding PadR family transcriptional regulator
MYNEQDTNDRRRGRMRERGWHGRGGPHRRGGRMRRGEIRTALLATLAEGPGHGYEVMQRLEEKSGGAWRPSPGSVYPTLQLLQDEGLVTSTERDGKRIYEITEAGRNELEQRTKDAGGPPWPTENQWSVYGQLRDGAVGVITASRQIAKSGNEAQIQRAVEIVRDARKRLYQLLGED